MANVLGTLFQDIADAIRSKTGDTAKLSPNGFAAAIEAIAVGSGGGAASDDVRYVTFMNGDTVLYKKAVATGDDCVDVLAKGLIETPTKESDDQYDYTYYGWGASDGGAADSTILQSITEDKTVYAIFTGTLRSYTITWRDDDGTELKSETLLYGAVPSYTPTKEGYGFAYWTPTPTAVTGDASYTAVWSSVVASGSCGSAATWALDGDGVLTIKGTGTMTSTPWRDSHAADITKVVIEDGITSLYYYAFQSCTALASVEIPSSVTDVKYSYVFDGCTALTSLVIPKGTILGDYFCRNCTSLTSVELPSTLTQIGSGAFYGCNVLPSITIPSGVTKISSSAFASCKALTSITIPSGVTTLYSDTFQSTALTSVSIHANLTLVADSAFQNCKSLTEIKVDEGNSAYCDVDGVMFNKAVTLLHILPCGKTGAYTLPSTVTTIGARSCWNTCLTSLTIPSSVKTINSYACYPSGTLTSVIFETTDGWYVTTTSGASSGTSITVTNASTAATYFHTTYRGYYWYRK